MRVLVTGGAGFIGSHLADALVDQGHAVRILDDLSTGRRDNVNPAAEFILGDVARPEDTDRAVDGVEVVFHQAAHGSVLRSVQSPLSTDLANTHGTLNVLESARAAGVRRVVAASSSSVYGGAKTFPTPESEPLRPRSPYAVTKLAGEHYCRVFAELYGLETVALRYFNIYGPRQPVQSAYAAVIPLFVHAVRSGEAAIVHGNGLQSRDFTFVADAVSANLAAAAAPAFACSGRVYNVAAGASRSLLEVLQTLGRLLGREPKIEFGDQRAGDVRQSEADISAARRDLGYAPSITLEEGLRRTLASTITDS